MMSKNLSLTEEKRYESQLKIDSEKSRADRYRFGQFSTPRGLADEILEYSKSINSNKEIRFIDPAFGTGSFYTALLKSYGDRVKESIGFEIDGDYFKAAVNTWKEYKSLKLINSDFTKNSLSESKFNLMVCNPPYTRHHQLDQDTKEKLKDAVKGQFPFKVSGLSGLHVYFMLLCDQWMSNNGLSLWLIPSEIFEVNYGDVIRHYLLENVDLVRIHFFEQSSVKFDDALVSSCVVVFRHGKTSSNKVEISCGDSILHPSAISKIDREELTSKNKWSKRMALTKAPEKTKTNKKSYMLGDFFEVKRGIATGDNGFFILEKSVAQSLEVPKKYLRNILPSSRYIRNGIINLDEDGFLKTEKKLVMLDIDLPLHQIQDLYPKLFDYLQKGILAGVDKKYLTSRRKPWYSQEKRQPPDYFIRYMSRERENSNSKSLVIVNKTDAVATNSYLLLYLKKQTTLESQLYGGDILAGLIERLGENLSHLGRTYGGGLVKFEPSELKQISFQI